MSHANARLTQYARLLAVRRVEQGHKPGEVAKQLGVSRQTIYKWVRRHREEGVAGLIDRSSRPHHSPRRTPLGVELRIVRTRLDEHAGPAALSGLLGLPPRRSAQCCAAGSCRTWAGSTGSPARSSAGKPPMSATNETDPASCCTSMSKSSVASRTAAAGEPTAAASRSSSKASAGTSSTSPSTTAPKAERFNRTLQNEWAYATAWLSNDQRTAALTDFLDRYNTRRGHSALGGHPPISRLAA